MSIETAGPRLFCSQINVSVFTVKLYNDFDNDFFSVIVIGLSVNGPLLYTVMAIGKLTIQLSHSNVVLSTKVCTLYHLNLTDHLFTSTRSRERKPWRRPKISATEGCLGQLVP